MEPFSWPRAPLNTRIGYAGGIGPENVIEVLGGIGPVGDGTWIDMESRVRDAEDRFDLNKVWVVLDKVAAMGWPSEGRPMTAPTRLKSALDAKED